MMTNIFCIESPLQLTSAIKVIREKQLKNNFFIVRFNGFKSNDEQLLKLLSEHKLKFTSMIVEPHSRRIFFLLFHAWFKCFLSYNKASIYLGDFRSLWQRCFSFFKVKLNIIDDGLATLNILDKLNCSSSKRKFKVITSLPIKSSMFKNVDMEFIVSRKKIKRVDESLIVFIGSPLVEKNIVDLNFWEESLSLILNDIEGDVLYIPHRSEKNIFNIKCDNLHILKIGESIEGYFEKLDLLPSEIHSFYSTAIVNLATEYDGPRFYSYMIPKSKINHGFKESTINAYSFIGIMGNINVKEIF